MQIPAKAAGTAATKTSNPLEARRPGGTVITTTARSWVSVLACALVAGGGFACFTTVRSGPPAAAPSPVPDPAGRTSDTGGTDDPEAADATVEAAQPVLPAGGAEAVAASVLALQPEEVAGRALRNLEAALAQLARGELQALEEPARRLGRDERAGLVYAELAYVHMLGGETEEARRYASLASGAGAVGRAQDVAGAILRGRVADLMAPDLVIGAILPVTGSPSNREYTRLFMEGVEVAAELARLAGWRVEFLVEDNRGTPSGSERGVTALVARGAAAILGPLNAENMESAVRMAPGRVAFLSPTARRLPFGRRGAYSLGAGDSGAGRALAGAVRVAGYREAVIVHASSPGEVLEADAFQDAFQDSGGMVSRRLRYEPGTTTFNLELREVEARVPEVLVVAAPAADVELLAPQVAFFGLDTLDIGVAGTAAWTTPEVLESVARRHTDSVIAVSARDPLAAFDPADAFVQAYERHFRRTLVSPVPAAGFDLFRMALAAYGDGLRTSRGTIGSLERLDRFRGATGTYSHLDGRIEREFFPVRILDGSIHPFAATLTTPADTVGIHPGGERGRSR